MNPWLQVMKGNAGSGVGHSVCSLHRDQLFLRRQCREPFCLMLGSYLAWKAPGNMSRGGSLHCSVRKVEITQISPVGSWLNKLWPSQAILKPTYFYLSDLEMLIQCKLYNPCYKNYAHSCLSEAEGSSVNICLLHVHLLWLLLFFPCKGGKAGISFVNISRKKPLKEKIFHTLAYSLLTSKMLTRI